MEIGTQNGGVGKNPHLRLSIEGSRALDERMEYPHRLKSFTVDFSTLVTQISHIFGRGVNYFIPRCETQYLSFMPI